MKEGQPHLTRTSKVGYSVDAGCLMLDAFLDSRYKLKRRQRLGTLLTKAYCGAPCAQLGIDVCQSCRDRLQYSLFGPSLLLYSILYVTFI